MGYTMQFSSNATSKAATYTDILQQAITCIVNDSALNSYELKSISKYTEVLCGWMSEEATKRQCPIVPSRGDY